MDKEGSQTSRISLEDFTDTVLASVSRAIDARTKSAIADRFPVKRPGPILVGIIWWPEGGPTTDLPEGGVGGFDAGIQGAGGAASGGGG